VSSADVYHGTWDKTEVALKVFRTEFGIRPSSSVCINFNRYLGATEVSVTDYPARN
jgi:hypothetical protein